MLDSSSSISLPGFFFQDPSSWVSLSRLLLQDSSFRIPPLGFLFQDYSFRIPPSGFLFQDPSSRIPSLDFLLEESSPSIASFNCLGSHAGVIYICARMRVCLVCWKGCLLKRLSLLLLSGCPFSRSLRLPFLHRTNDKPEAASPHHILLSCTFTQRNAMPGQH